MLIFAMACSNNNDGEKDDCIDVSQINNSGVCYEVYAPVCGCNNETYEKDCKARIKGAPTSRVHSNHLAPRTIYIFRHFLYHHFLLQIYRHF